jgi:hypothetical protein
MDQTGGDVDERPRWAGEPLLTDDHRVLALEDVKGLCGVVVDMEWRPEARRLVGFLQAELTPCRFPVSFDEQTKSAHIDRPAFARPKNERLPG